MNCLFCAIINGEIPSTKIYEDDFCYAFLDINPQAPVHFLVVPKLHLSSLDEVINDLDMLYMTRIQRERFASEEDYL